MQVRNEKPKLNLSKVSRRRISSSTSSGSISNRPEDRPDAEFESSSVLLKVQRELPNQLLTGTSSERKESPRKISPRNIFGRSTKSESSEDGSPRGADKSPRSENESPRYDSPRSRFIIRSIPGIFSSAGKAGDISAEGNMSEEQVMNDNQYLQILGDSGKLKEIINKKINSLERKYFSFGFVVTQDHVLCKESETFKTIKLQVTYFLSQIEYLQRLSKMGLKRNEAVSPATKKKILDSCSDLLAFTEMHFEILKKYETYLAKYNAEKKAEITNEDPSKKPQMLSQSIKIDDKIIEISFLPSEAEMAREIARLQNLIDTINKIYPSLIYYLHGEHSTAQQFNVLKERLLELKDLILKSKTDDDFKVVEIELKKIEDEFKILENQLPCKYSSGIAFKYKKLMKPCAALFQAADDLELIIYQSHESSDFLHKYLNLKKELELFKAEITTHIMSQDDSSIEMLKKCKGYQDKLDKLANLIKPKSEPVLIKTTLPPIEEVKYNSAPISRHHEKSDELVKSASSPSLFKKNKVRNEHIQRSMDFMQLHITFFTELLKEMKEDKSPEWGETLQSFIKEMESAIPDKEYFDKCLDNDEAMRDLLLKNEKLATTLRNARKDPGILQAIKNWRTSESVSFKSLTGKK